MAKRRPDFRALRKASGLTAREVAARAGITHAYVSKIEGGAIPSQPVRHALLSVYACGIESPDDVANALAKNALESASRHIRCAMAVLSGGHYIRADEAYSAICVAIACLGEGND